MWARWKWYVLAASIWAGCDALFLIQLMRWWRILCYEMCSPPVAVAGSFEKLQTWGSVIWGREKSLLRDGRG
jgi:hypothetical protein